MKLFHNNNNILKEGTFEGTFRVWFGKKYNVLFKYYLKNCVTNIEYVGRSLTVTSKFNIPGITQPEILLPGHSGRVN